MRLYTHKLSPFSAKIRVALDEKGIAYEEIALPISRNAILDKPAELRALNPREQVPVLVDGDVAVYDSTVILEYLEERAPAPALLPHGLAARARARQLEDHGDWLVGGCILDLLAETYRKPDPAARDAAKQAQAVAAVERELDRLERELAGRDSSRATSAPPTSPARSR
jgi:glutathione S-transferase